MSFFSRSRAARGFTLVEMLVVLAIAAMVLAVATPWLYQAWKRQRLMSPVREIYSLVLATRMQAVKRNQDVVMFIDLPNRRITTWADCVVAPCPGGGVPRDYVQTGEPTINIYQIPSNIFFRFAPDGLAVNSPSAVAFDTYPGPAAAVVDSIVFRGDGTIVPPQCSWCAQPLKPATYTATVPQGSINCPATGCRGIYMADNGLTGGTANRNVFRISVDDFGRTGKGSLLKWVPTGSGNSGEHNYVPPVWDWVN